MTEGETSSSSGGGSGWNLVCGSFLTAWGSPLDPDPTGGKVLCRTHARTVLV